MKLIINKPFIQNNRLISLIEYDKNKYEMYFEVTEEYKQYLCCELADAFIISLLPFVIKHEYDIEIKNSYVSIDLYYQLSEYLIPMLCNAFQKKKIRIFTDTKIKQYNAKGVGASISCGVDSFYTLLKHINLKEKEYNITHLTFFNAGSNGQYGGKEARKLFKARIEYINKFCNENNFKLVTVDTNMNELLKMDHEKTHTFRTLGCVFALQKLFGKYYFASGIKFDNSHIDERDTAFYDILNVKELSTSNITFYCDGIETDRMDKIKYISNFPITYKWLNVCVNTNAWKNCGHCVKCRRTMTELDSIGKLEKYKDVFDIDYYKKNKVKILANLLKERKNKVQREFAISTIKEFKKRNIKISLISYFLSIIPNKKDIKGFIKLFIPKILVKKIKIKRNTYIDDGWI